MLFRSPCLTWVLRCAAIWTMSAFSSLASALDANEFSDQLFENSIRPVLVERCFRCHGEANVKVAGMLRVDSRAALLTGGDSGPAIVPGKPDESLIMKAIERSDEVSPMPPEKEKALRKDQVAAFREWIGSGAPWPEKSSQFTTAQHWAFAPLKVQLPPTVPDSDWSRSPIDQFIRSSQIDAGVVPAGHADKRTLIRRATFNLTGLPPTPDEVDAFENDESAEAYARLIDRLLESSHYGERWGRHWLDVVRYADTAGETADYPVPEAWRYRNYVIDAFNSDKPYDRFVQEQIAGDVLANQLPNDQYAQQVTATGYLAISRRFGFDSENYHHLTIQDTIDTLGQSVLGLSLGCARCHDHKFDPVSMQDYYALYGIFDSTRYAFPGSEQKQKVRSLAPLVPPRQSMETWREFDRRVGCLATALERQKLPVPAVVLRSLSDIDGDFELQAPAAGGSNGVLVPPWLYSGKIAVTSEAQSPFKNLYARGKVGASIPAGNEAYRIAQSLYPRRTQANCPKLYVNLDFRVGPNSSPSGSIIAGGAAHRLWLGDHAVSSTVCIAISSDSLAIETDTGLDKLAALQPGQWHSLQLCIDLVSRSVSGSLATLTTNTVFESKPLVADWSGAIDYLMMRSPDHLQGTLPAVEFDNLGIQDFPLNQVTSELSTSDVVDVIDGHSLTELRQELQTVAGMGGDFELQKIDSPPSSPWNAGPNSLVRLSANSQSPYQNIFPPGELGIHMPNRAEYDGFGVALPTTWKPDTTEHLSASVDFRCGNCRAGGEGSWRFYIGHGPGASAAVELFMNGQQLFRRSADQRDSVAPLEVNRWYQIQLDLDLKNRKYTGILASTASKQAFSGEFASGWDGTIDHSFIDSYGHIAGARPALDVDNYVVQQGRLPEFDGKPSQAEMAAQVSMRSKALQLQQQLQHLETRLQQRLQELNDALARGPFEMAYAMAEGTPHDVQIQLRGEPDQPGEIVRRGFIKVLGGAELPAETRGSGRLELARWLTQPNNALTPRVIVNRIWQYHFGRGLVKTPNDFGARGLPPTHPELLDYLADHFVRSGWSIKAMHRLIMSSETYQQASVMQSGMATEQASIAAEQDKSALLELYALFRRRRLSAEEIRDSILAVSGQLDREPAKAHPFPTPIKWGYSQHGPFSAVYDHNKRSIYLMTQRLKRHPFLALFDGADPNATTADRLGTTVPTQALYFLNDAFVHEKSLAWAEQLGSDRAGATEWIQLAYQAALGRAARQEETHDAEIFLTNARAEIAAVIQKSEDDPQVTKSARASLLRTLIGSNEFLHID